MNSFDNVIDVGFKAFGVIVAFALVALFLKDASQFNTLASGAGTFAKDLGSLG